LIFWFLLIFLHSKHFVGTADWEDEEEGTGRSGNEGEEIRVVDAEDVVEGESFREAKIVDEGGHYFGVVLCGDSQREVTGT
jgi:hypothetical protein